MTQSAMDNARLNNNWRSRRSAFHADVSGKIIAEIGKDPAKHPTSDIEKHFFSNAIE